MAISCTSASMYRIWWIFFAIGMMFGCNEHSIQELDSIETLMKQQEVSWNEGDLQGFMQPYLQSDSLVFVGKRGLTYGWDNTLNNYLKGYPNKEAMGQLQFTNLKKEMLSDSSAWVIGKWELFRNEDTLSGHYTLLWKKMNGNWKIVADHSS